MSNFRTIDRQTGFLLPPSVDEWLPEKHLARFVVEVIEGLDASAMSSAYRGSGSASYHPRLLLGILIYGYATGVFSSRKLERATYDSVAFRFIAANDHPDHDTIAISERLPLTINVRFPGGGLRRRSRRCSFRSCCWRARWACLRWAQSRWTARRSTPTRASTARFLTSMRARLRRN
jgi:hypothetical protein